MNLPALAIKRPITTIMIVLIAVLTGLASLTGVGLDLLPDISFPVVIVVTQYSGAGPQEVESLVSRPLEEAVSIVTHVKNIISQSVEGRSIVMAEFDWGTDMEMAALEIREKIDLVKGFLPDEVDDPLVIRADPSLLPQMQINLSTTKDLTQLTAFAEDVVKPRLERVQGVSSVSIYGGAQREISVEIDPARLQGYGLSLTQITSVLMAENLNLPGGSLEEGGQRLILRTVGQFASTSDIEDVVFITPTGAPVRLGDFATVSENLAEATQISRLNKEVSVGLSLQKQSGENTVLVSRSVHKAIDELLEELPEGTEMVVSMDQARFVNVALRGVLENMIYGGILAIVLLFTFLRSYKTTLIISISIPVSIIATFSLLFFTGLTLNLMTLGGLALGIGMLVDNSIVVIEAIFRHRQMGKDPAEAALEGTREVGTAVVASTLTTLAVFVPIIFIPGMASEIFSELAATVTFSLITSLVVSLTIIPLAASRVDLEPDIEYRWVRSMGSYLDSFKERYKARLKWCLSHRRKVLGGSLLLLVFSLAILPFLGAELMGSLDWGEITVNVTMPPGVPLEETDRVVRTIEEASVEMPDVESVYLQAGRTTGMETSPTDTGTIGIRLKKKRELSTEQVIQDLRRVAADIPGASISVESAGGIIAGTQMFGDPVSVYVRGDDLSVLEEIGERIKKEIAEVPGTREVTTNTAHGKPEIQILVDRDKAGLFGLTAAQVSMAVRTAMEGAIAGQYRGEGEEIDIRVILESRTASALEDLSLQSPLGLQVPLRDVAEMKIGAGPSVIERHGQSRVAQVTAQVTGRDLGSVNKNVKAKLKDLRLPPGYSLEIGGETQMMYEAFSDLSYSMIFAIALVYMVLASQFESLLQPVIIMGTLPMAIVGVSAGLAIARFPLSIPVMIGLITLVGIVVNNAIVFLDYLNQLRKGDLSREEAIIEAGATRLRPILMTTLTTVLGMLPLALGLGEGTELHQPMAVAVIGGLSSSTLLTLLVLPLVYAAFDDFLGRFRR